MLPSADTHDAFEHYLHEVAKYPLIGDASEERELARRARAGDREAAERLVTANLRFVISFVKRYRGRGLATSELVCLGNQGLLEAVDRFDPERGVKFISYAVWWVRQCVLRGIAEQGRPVRLPLNQHGSLVSLARTRARLTQSLGRLPTDDEIAGAMNETVEIVRSLRRVDAPEVCLDAPSTGPDVAGPTVGERFSDGAARDVENDLEAVACRDLLDEMFRDYLTERERKILHLYYGLDGHHANTLEEIGSVFGVTRERIRQIRNRAFDKLRRSPHGESLSRFWSTQ